MVEIVNFVLNFPKAYLQLDVLSLVSSHLSLDRSLKFKPSQNLMNIDRSREMHCCYPNYQLLINHAEAAKRITTV